MEPLTILLFGGTTLITGAVIFMLYPSKKEREELAAMHERLKDETITIPSTGEKFTLDDGESTIWMKEADIAGEAVASNYDEVYFKNYLSYVSENKMLKKDLTQADFDLIESLWLANYKNDEWYYSDPYENNELRILFIKSEDLSSIDVLCEFKVENSNVQILALEKSSNLDAPVYGELMDNDAQCLYETYLLDDNRVQVESNPILQYLKGVPRFDHELFNDALFVIFDLKMFEQGAKRVEDLKRIISKKKYRN